MDFSKKTKQWFKIALWLYGACVIIITIAHSFGVIDLSAYNTYYRRTFDKLLNTVQQDVLESYKHKISGVYGAMGFYDMEKIIHRFNTPPVVFATTRGGKGSDRV